MKVLIQKAKQEKKLLALYSNEESYSTRVIGLVIDDSDEWLLLKYYDPAGNYDGYIVKNLEHVYRAEIDTEYHAKIDLLRKGQEDEGLDIPLTTHPLLDLLAYAQKERRTIRVEIGDDENTDIVRGYVEKVTDDCLYLNQVTYTGETGGEGVFKLRVINEVWLDDKYCRSVETLIKIKSSMN